MELETFIKNFEAAVEDVEVGTLSGETAFRDMKCWDSLAVLTATDMVDIEYGVLLSKSDFTNAQTIEDLFNNVASKSRL